MGLTKGQWSDQRRHEHGIRWLHTTMEHQRGHDENNRHHILGPRCSLSHLFVHATTHQGLILNPSGPPC